MRRFAESHGMEIVKTYSDHGRSGLNLSGREALRRLLEDVKEGRADYSEVLVYDVSRWGRFQDADESAYYEYILKAAGIRVPGYVSNIHSVIRRTPIWLKSLME